MYVTYAVSKDQMHMFFSCKR